MTKDQQQQQKYRI